MKQNALKNVRILGIQCAVPRNVICNEFFTTTFSRMDVEKTTEMTGVKSRHFVDQNTCTSDLCIIAAKKLMSDLSWEPSSIDGIIFLSQTPDYRLPATSCVIQDILGLPSDCFAFDVNLGCSGYVYGLWMAGNIISSGCAKRILFLAGDTLSKTFSPQDRSTAMLFGDAGTATALEYDKNAPHMAFVLGTDGKGKENLIIPAGGYREPSNPQTTTRGSLPEGGTLSREDIFMDGGEIFNFTIKRVPSLVKALLEDAEIGINDVDYFVFHQANKFIIKHLAKKLKLSSAQTPMSIADYGNTSSASIPVTIAACLMPDLRTEEKILALVGFGVGYSWGAALVKTGPFESLGIVEV